MSWIVVVSLLSARTPGDTLALNRVGMVGTVTTVVGLVGAIAFGIWLAISLDAFQVWDGWVIAAIVLWAIAAEVGRRAGEGYGEAGLEAGKLAEAGTPTSPLVAETFGASRAFWFHAASSVLFVLVLIDMIWKPG